MSVIHRDIFVTRHQRIQPIDIVSGSQVGIELQLMDYDIPAGASAKAYARGRYAPNTYKADCTISGNTVSFTPPDGFFIPDPNRLQIEINGVVIPFSIDVNCESRVSDGGDPATPEQVRPLVERAETAAKKAEKAAADSDAALEEIKTDYPAIPELNNEINAQQKVNATQNGRLDNLEEAAQGYLYREAVNTAETHEKTVPPETMKWATLDKIGGKTLVWNQMVGADATNVSLAAGRKYFARIVGVESIIASDGTNIAVSGGTDMVCDLTAMFGAGSELNAPEEFRAMFLADYYPYCKPTLRNFSSSAVVSSTGHRLDTSAIVRKYFPEGMKSAGTVHDEIDFGRMVAIQRVGSVTYDGESVKVTSAPLTDVYKDTTKKYNFAFIPEYNFNRLFLPYKRNGEGIATNGEHANTAADAHEYGGITIFSTISVFVPNVATEGNTREQYLEAFNGALKNNPVSVNYELNAPVETPIVEVFDPSIMVKSGGMLTFENDQGADFCVPVPNQETFTAKTGYPDMGTLLERLKSGKIEDAELHLGFYLDENGDLCQKEE